MNATVPTVPSKQYRKKQPAFRCDISQPLVLEPDEARTSWRFLAALVIAGYLLFCHGCHGDEDTEPFAALAVRTIAAGPR
jgi:hypothetical protein